MVRINVGCGHIKLDGWINVDRDPACQPDLFADLTAGLPFRSSIADYMHCEDFIDQITVTQAETFLGECHRVLRPGAVMRVLTPDLARLTDLYLHHPDRLEAMWRDNVPIDLELGTPAEILNLGMRLLGHEFLYDAETFELLAARCGFRPERTGYGQSAFEPLRGVDFRDPQTGISMYYDCVRV